MNPPVFTRNRLVSCGSSLLSDGDNMALLKIIGNGRQSLSAAVVQIFKASEPNYNKWLLDATGIACVVKDHRNRCYAIYLYSLEQNRILLNESIYPGFCYNTPKPTFHTFETKDLIYGLNFTQRAEADHFTQTLFNKTRIKKKQAPTVISPTPDTITKGDSQKGKKKKNKVNLITTNMVSGPRDFQHISHVGWDPDKGLNMDKVDPALLEIFKNAGINENLIKDEETLDFVYNFINQYGGMEAVRTQTREDAKAPAMAKPPLKAPPSMPPKPSDSMHIPSRPRIQPPSHPEKPSPTPPSISKDAEQISIPTPESSDKFKPSPSDSAVYIDKSEPSPPPPPPMQVSPAATKSEQPKPGISPMRGDLLSSIRQGASLSKVIDEPKVPVAEEGGIAGLLKKAIESRHNALNSDDDDWADRDEWSD